MVHRDLMALFDEVPILVMGSLPKGHNADGVGNSITPDQR